MRRIYFCIYIYDHLWVYPLYQDLNTKSCEPLPSYLSSFTVLQIWTSTLLLIFLQRVLRANQFGLQVLRATGKFHWQLCRLNDSYAHILYSSRWKLDTKKSFTDHGHNIMYTMVGGAQLICTKKRSQHPKMWKTRRRLQPELLNGNTNTIGFLSSRGSMFHSTHSSNDTIRSRR
jgi:hypothetical protein